MNKTKTFKIRKYKLLKFQACKRNTPIIIYFKSKYKCNNQGWVFSFGLIWLFNFRISYYDTRHWNHKDQRFFMPNEEETNNEINRTNLEKLGFVLMYSDGIYASYYHKETYLDNAMQSAPRYTLTVDNKNLKLISYYNFNATFQRYVKTINDVEKFLNFFNK